jgi:hypothetical protein
MEEVGTMRFYSYKEYPHDYSQLSLEELNALIEQEKEKLKNMKPGELLPELKNFEV